MDLSDVKAFKAILEASGKKLGGRKGNAATRALNMAIAKVIEKKGGEIKKGFNGGSEQRYTNGKKGKGNSRYSDGGVFQGSCHQF